MWLDDVMHIAEFRCETCKEEFEVTSNAKDWPPLPPICVHADCAGPLTYMGMKPYALGGLTRITFEQNGIAAVKITDSKGMITCRSKSKGAYMDKGILPDSVHAAEGPRPKSLAANTPKYSQNSKGLK